MPRGVAIEEHETVCRHCGVTFMTTRIGKASWFCKRPECDADRVKVQRRTRAEAPRVVKPQPSAPAAKILRDPELHPYLEDLAAIAAMAKNVTPSRDMLRDVVRVIAAGNLDNPQATYRRLAAVALVLAHGYRRTL